MNMNLEKSKDSDAWRQLFVYDKQSGTLLWKSNRPKRKAGDPAGNVSHKGRYISMHATVNGVKHRHFAHRVIWEMHNGKIPEGMCIDHIDGNGLNNRLNNLRITTLSGNHRNESIPKNNRTGIVGVSPIKNSWQVQIAGRYMGCFMDFFEACCARKSSELQFGFHENHGRRRS